MDIVEGKSKSTCDPGKGNFKQHDKDDSLCKKRTNKTPLG